MSDPILAFNTHEACALTSVSLRRLQYWDETDFIRPSIAARHGRGSPRLYGFRDLIALRIAARLRDQLSLHALRKLKDALDVDAPFASVRFALLPGGDVVYLGPTGQLEAARRPGQITMSFDIPLEEIRADLRTSVDALRERSGVGAVKLRSLAPLIGGQVLWFLGWRAIFCVWRPICSSSMVTPLSGRPSVHAKPELVVASALYPSAASSRALPMSHGLGMTKQPAS